jgi:hypothetical protein
MMFMSCSLRALPLLCVREKRRKKKGEEKEKEGKEGKIWKFCQTKIFEK